MFELPEGITRKQIILKLLLEARVNNSPFKLYDGGKGNTAYISGGWFPVYALQTPQIGGSSAGRRLREISFDHGVPKEDKVHKYEYYGYNGELIKNSIHIHRIALTPQQITAYPWEEDGAFDTPFKWIFNPMLLGKKTQEQIGLGF